MTDAAASENIERIRKVIPQFRERELPAAAQARDG